ncbi:hypothetical protein [Cryptosporangium phraense]|uniref:Uncharacterized protein n=1 Tax=Cryptosporangium phraense TaxID=2593070 RepID=A0A545AIF2_9ACTN|nr:hypothetical protein [Cryptosporangium phraense]TQS41093.1 hypothetical protein FL583_31525 [Cryptosporangium phraense]
MRWGLAAVVLAGGFGLAYVAWGLIDNVAVASTLVFLALICACMIVALWGGDESVSRTTPDRRGGRSVPRR